VELDVVLNDRVIDIVEEDSTSPYASTSDWTTARSSSASSAPEGESCARHRPTSEGTAFRRIRAISRTIGASDTGLHASPPEWRFEGAEGTCAVKVSGPLQINNSVAIREAALAEVGIAMTPDFVAADDVRATTSMHPKGLGPERIRRLRRLAAIAIRDTEGPRVRRVPLSRAARERGVAGEN